MNNRFQIPFALLGRSPTFGRLWAAQTVSLLGDSMTFIALPWFVLELTGSGTATAGVLLSLHLPAVVTGLVAGSLVDRFQPRTILAADNAIRTLVVALIPLLYWLERLELWHVYVLALLAGMLQPATLVGSRTIIPDLVDDEDLDRANMLWAFSANLTVVIGPAVAGMLVAAFGGPSVLLLDAATFAAMALVSATLPDIRRAAAPGETPLLERLGLRQVWRIRVVRLTTLLSLVFFFSYGPLEAALPVYSRMVLQTDARGYGLLWAALGVGALLGTLGSAHVSRHLRLGVALPLIAVLWGASLLPAVFVDELWLACAFLALGGLMWGPYTPLETTLLQRSVAKEELGRVFGARSALLTSGAPLGLALGGALLAFVPPTVLIALSSSACVLVGLGGLASPTLRNLSVPAPP
ncbi:MAG TPA: MFS transporter [Ardenticatenaceae bacterium]|nr:MFS transporter [Ardenticatenaceae bacterium]